MRKARQPRVRSDIGPIPGGSSGTCSIGDHYWCGGEWIGFTGHAFICTCDCHEEDDYGTDEE